MKTVHFLTMTRFFPLLIILTGCTNPAWAPLHHGPLFRTAFQPAFGGPVAGTTETPGSSTRPTVTDLRRRIVSEAEILAHQTTSVPQYGTEDVQRIAEGVVGDTLWKPGTALETVVDAAKSCGAYQTGRAPRNGDIVLFHNQSDLNGNGTSDDWFTGCGIVTDSDGSHIEVTSRTGNAPRRIELWLDGPSVYTHKGKVVNGFARVPTRNDPQDAEYLSKQLYAGFIDVEIFAQHCSGSKK